MITIVNNLVPVFALIALGQLLGKKGFLPKEFFQFSDKLVYFIFFPVMLFWKIGGANTAEAINWRLTLAVLGLLTAAWVLSLLYARVSGMPSFHVGAFSQCCYRFNTYIAMAVVLSALGEDGVRDFGILISVVIPYLNVLAVSTLIWHAKGEYSTRTKVTLLIKAMIANPLIIGCLAGIAYSMTGIPFPRFFSNTFRLLSVSSLPLALLSVGNALTFGVLKGYLGAALASCGIKLLFLPGAGWILFQYLGVEAFPMKVAMFFLAMPTSVSAYILSAQLESDPDMAAACIVLSTLLSFVSLSAVMLI